MVRPTERSLAYTGLAANLLVLEYVSKFIFPSIMQAIFGSTLNAQTPNTYKHACRNGFNSAELLSLEKTLRDGVLCTSTSRKTTALIHWTSGDAVTGLMGSNVFPKWNAPYALSANTIER